MRACWAASIGPRTVRGLLPGLWLACVATSGALSAGPPASHPATTRPATTRPAATQPGPALFQPGVLIDWGSRQVLISATVILREGDLELFACAPKRREHEAIVRIEALPTHVYQALGLVGLTPGKPMRVNEQLEYHAATGDALDIDIEYTSGGQVRRNPIEAWLARVDGGPLARRLPWVFAGSLPLEQGRGLAADLEGTVIAVVDFPTSLIALAESHSESNAELWLRPATGRIPLIGTSCWLIVRASPLRLHLQADGRLRLRDRPIARGAMASLLRKGLADDPALRVELTVEDGADRLEERSLIGLLRTLGIREDALTILDTSGAKRPIIH